MHFSEGHNNELLKENLDLLEELREKAFLRVQRYKNIMINAYNKRVKARNFQVGNLVLRREDALKPVGKLDSTWEGPYKITSVIGRGVYRLEDLERRPYPVPGTSITSKNIMPRSMRGHRPPSGSIPLTFPEEGYLFLSKGSPHDSDTPTTGTPTTAA
ncbi:UNVERIFIED_CONTAM: hypothetical protein Slati_0110300 [Sesamum latifolium]|uniref:Uncharacterized protein n=1 Tax=Sesamum latifolium TaxID=2727402 RepID=A0AAW2Y8R0_9LAMI